MLRYFELFMPVIIPSWRFFDVIGPSPRIEVCFLKHPADECFDWVEYRPRPQKLSFINMIRRLVWNPDWNESLFLMRCAERIIEGEEEFCRQEIFKRMKRDYPDETFVKFRIVFYSRDRDKIVRHLAYISPLEML